MSLKTFISNPNVNSDFDLYKKFAEEKKKPFMIAETAAAYYPDFEAQDGEVDIKKDWWEQFWSDETMKAYPLLKVPSPLPITLASVFSDNCRLSYGSSTIKPPTQEKPETTQSPGTMESATPS